MAMQDPMDLFVYELSAMYEGENRIAQMLPQVADEVGSDTLRQALQTHEQETREQVANLERCFETLGVSRQQVTCAGIEGIKQEHDTFAQQQPSQELLTMFDVGGAIKIEHYEIAAYRGLIDKAILLGQPGVAHGLQTILMQEQATAGKLERIAHEMGETMLQRQPAAAGV